MSLWRPSLSEFVAPFAKTRSWDISLERFKKGIDNAHIDVYLSPRFRDGVRETVRKLILEDTKGQSRQFAREPIGTEDLKNFREGYVGIFGSLAEKGGASLPVDRLALLQISLLKHLIQAVAREKAALHDEFNDTAREMEVMSSGLGSSANGHFIQATGGERVLNRRVLRFLFRQVGKLESSHLRKVRESLVGEAWPLPRRAFFNPVLMFPDLDEVTELSPAYPIARLGEGGDTDWLFQTNQCVSTVFQYYLPNWTRLPSYRGATGEGGGGAKARERRDQGQLQGFLGTEMLLRRFVPAEEYLPGRCSWMDDPENLRMFLGAGGDRADSSGDLPESTLSDLREPESGFAPDSSFDRTLYSDVHEPESDNQACWNQDGWPDFQRAVVGELHRCLDLKGLGQRIVLLYWLPAIRTELGRPVPLSLVLDFVAGRLSRRRLAQRLEAHQLALDPAFVARVLERVVANLRRVSPEKRARYLNAYLADFLVLRRDLKLAYKTYEAMDLIRLLDDPREVQLSRANASVYEFSSGEGRASSKRRIICHVVLKADVRGSTRITERLREMGLNPASHFSLSFFDPVNKLLPEFGAEKLFVEGDAVILAWFEHEAEPAAMVVSRACGLARSMLQVVTLKNIINRKHGLPDLELGLGISFSRREPNFLYDEGHRIMISGAINRADRLSSCAAELKTGRFHPGDAAFRVEVVRDTSAGAGAVREDSLLSYNVNGIKLEKAAFFKLQKEMDLRQVRLPEAEMRDSLFFAGSFPDLAGKEHSLVLRYAPLREWNGRSLGPIDSDRGHFFEVIADEALATRVRKLALGKQGLPLRG